MSKKFLLLALLIFFINNVSATTTTTIPTDFNITLIHPLDGDTCYLPHVDDEGNYYIDYSYIPYTDYDSCSLYSNSSGGWAFKLISYDITSQVENEFDSYISVPNTILWGIKCIKTGVSYYSYNRTFTVTDKLYCAVLSETECPSNAPLNSEVVFKTRLGNTKGIWLENQDCNVWIENNNGDIVKKYPSMVYEQQIKQMLDTEGNWINTADMKYPLTDSSGYYIFPFLVDGKWAYYGSEYTIYASCNGQETSCSFNVTKEQLPDIDHLTALSKEAGGVIVFFLLLVMIAYILYKKRGAIL